MGAAGLKRSEASESAGPPRRPRRIARAVAVALVVTACAVLPIRAASNPISPDTARVVPCTPGVDQGCLPTPVECALGGYNGHWDGGAEGRLADCTGGAGHIVHYEGGYTGADQVHGTCGGVIDSDQVRAGGWADPNLCPPASAAPGFGVAGRALRKAVRSRRGVVAS